MKKNLDDATVASFGDEWSRFDQSQLSFSEAQRIFNEYFLIFPWEKLSPDASGFDMGCGSGRWAKLAAQKVGHLYCIDPSEALEIAKLNLADRKNVSFIRAAAEPGVLPNNSQDFGYSLGVLHHVPDTKEAMRTCVAMLKPGAPFLVYLYYAFDNRTLLFRLVWRLSDLLRKAVCRLPFGLKYLITDILAIAAYYPLARLSLLLEALGVNVAGIPLSYYRSHSFYTMRTDSRDRFGTPLERRFTRGEIESMMRDVGLENIVFSDSAPYWCAVGIKK